MERVVTSATKILLVLEQSGKITGSGGGKASSIWNCIYDEGGGEGQERGPYRTERLNYSGIVLEQIRTYFRDEVLPMPSTMCRVQKTLFGSEGSLD
jgi:hypothetical protein